MIVVKVGGSLYDLADLGDRLKKFVASLTPPILIVPGGGDAADAVRELDRIHHVGHVTSHWLALRACTLNGHFLAKITGWPVDSSAPIAIVDLYEFARRDEERSDHWPHHWDVTSDSMAVRVAACAGAKELILLKSREMPTGGCDEEIVDRFFPTAISRVPGLSVRVVNFRDR